MLHKQVGSRCLVGCLELPAWWPHLPEHQGELNLGVMELFGTLPLAELGRYSGSFDNLNAMRTDPVTRSHLSVHLLNSTIQSGITVLLVHVMITSSALVSQPNAVVLDCRRVLLKNLQKGQQFYRTVLIKLAQEAKKNIQRVGHRTQLMI